MKLVKVEDVVPGAKVAKDVTDLKGVLLFKAGTELAEKTLARIKARSITHIFISEGDEGAGGAADSPFKTPEEVNLKTDLLFRDRLDHEWMSALAEAVKRYHLARMG